MGIKIVQGLIGTTPVAAGDTRASTNQQNATQSAQAGLQAVIRAATAVTSSALATSEAVISSVRTNRSANSGIEKLRDPQQAKELAENVADRIRDGETGLEAHSDLEPISAREHFSN